MRRLSPILATLLLASPAIAQDAANPRGADPHANPHGSGGSGAPPGMFNPPPDMVDEDPTLPAGSIAVAILDPDDKPIPRAQASVGVLRNSVAKGESRSRLVRDTDENGFFRVDGQETGTGIAYRISVSKDGATFGSTPFQLSPARGIKVKLHVYPVTRDLNEALVVMQTVVYAEIKDDRVQLQSAMQIFNFGKTAWVPNDVYFELPDTFTAFRTNEEMSDRGVDAVDKKGGRLRGTFAPGRWDIEFRWQLPYAGEKDVSFEVGLPPHVAVARVMAQASQQMSLEVPAFAPAEPRFDNDGQRVLVTEKQLRREDAPLRRLKVTIANLPTQGPGRFLAAGLAAAGVLGGLAFAFTQRRPWKGKKELDKLERSQILAELEELERMQEAGDIGPKTYERARRELIDALARTLSKTAR